MPRVHLNIGSNLGDRTDNIVRAIASLRRSPGLVCDTGRIAVSQETVSDPWGFESSNSFVNVGFSFETTLSPRQVLAACRSVEKSLGSASHRTDTGGYADRIIDIDIIFYGDRVIDESDLKIPHPLMHLRRFVLVPLAGIDPWWVHPLSGLDARRMLEKIGK